MPIFECTRCGVADNSAISEYWGQQLDARDKGETFAPLCSECMTGKWHGQFPKELAKGKFVPDPAMPGFIMPPGGWK